MTEDYSKHIATILKYPLALMLVGIGGFLFTYFSKDQQWLGLLIGFVSLPAGLGVCIGNLRPFWANAYKNYQNDRKIKDELASLSFIESQTLKVMVSFNRRELSSETLKRYKLVHIPNDPPGFRPYEKSSVIKLRDISYAMQLLEEKGIGSHNSGYEGYFSYQLFNTEWEVIKKFYTSSFNTKKENFLIMPDKDNNESSVNG